MMYRDLGDLIQEGCVTKLQTTSTVVAIHLKSCYLARNVYLSPSTAATFSLSPSKTIICPKSITILCWMWSQGTLSGSPNSIAVFSSGLPPKV